MNQDEAAIACIRGAKIRPIDTLDTYTWANGAFYRHSYVVGDETICCPLPAYAEWEIVHSEPQGEWEEAEITEDRHHPFSSTSVPLIVTCPVCRVCSSARHIEMDHADRFGGYVFDDAIRSTLWQMRTPSGDIATEYYQHSGEPPLRCVAVHARAVRVRRPA